MDSALDPDTSPTEARSTSPAAYDAFAWFYERHWTGGLSAQLWAAAERLLVPRLPAGGRVLDVCCGTGVASAALLTLGFRVTGVDASRAMLARARSRAPGARFVAADVGTMQAGAGLDGALCLGEGFNHLLTAEHLARALGRVAAALRPGAPLVFDLVEESRYVAHWWGQTYETYDGDRAFATRGTYDRETALARMDLEVARRTDAGAWRGREHVLRQRCHTPTEWERALRGAGFAAEYLDAARDLGLADQAGRVFVVARRGRGR